MSEFLWIGTCLGAAVGFVHLLSIVSAQLGHPNPNLPKAVWTGLWVWALWILFGAYVLVLWIVGAILLGVSRLVRTRRIGQ